MAAKRKTFSKRATNMTAKSTRLLMPGSTQLSSTSRSQSKRIIHPSLLRIESKGQSAIFANANTAAYNPLMGINMAKRMSTIATDLKSQREIKKLKADLVQKTQAYNYSVQVSTSLTQENNTLKSHWQEAIAAKIAIEQHLNDKNEYLTATITDYTQKYKELQSKNEMLESQNKYHLVHLVETSTHLSQYSSSLNECMIQQQEIAILTQKVSDQEVIIEDLRNQIQQLKKNERNLNKMLQDLRQQLDDEMEHHLQTQRANEQQTAYLAATKANLEQQKKDLEELLDQREDGIAMLNEHIFYQQARQSQFLQALELRSLQAEKTDQSDITDAIGPRCSGKGSVLGVYYDQLNANYNPLDLYGFDVEDLNSDNEDESPYINEEDDGDIPAIPGFSTDIDITRGNDTPDKADDLKEENDDTFPEIPALSINIDTTEVDKQNKAKDIDDFAEDFLDELMEDEDFMASPVVQKMASITDDTKQHKINEYLHLTASAVKINYPNVKIETDELIKRVESLSFHQYYDEMVRIMEMEKRKMQQKEHLSYVNGILANNTDKKKQLWEKYIQNAGMAPLKKPIMSNKAGISAMAPKANGTNGRRYQSVRSKHGHYASYDIGNVMMNKGILLMKKDRYSQNGINGYTFRKLQKSKSVLYNENESK